MFSRGSAGTPQGTGSPHPSTRKRENEEETPLEELTSCLDRLEALVVKARSSWEEQKTKQTAAKKQGRSGLFRRSSGGEEKDEKTKQQKTLRKTQHAELLSLKKGDETEMIELLRRTAELVVMGEKGAAAAQSRHDKRTKERIEYPDGGLSDEEAEKEETSVETYIALFEQFFERNALSLIVTLVTGAAFFSSSGNVSASAAVDSSLASSAEDSGEDSPATILPPLPVATQAVQSVSILIQNVSRATSLYFLLSNNYINELINLPLDLYRIAERKKRMDSGMGSAQYTSPELAELNTHFVSLLKSLALRMNKETLQFFLTYPTEQNDFNASTASSAYFSQRDEMINNLVKESSSYDASKDEALGTIKTRRKKGSSEDRPLDEVETNRSTPETDSAVAKPVVVREVVVDFPLYARALEFCSPNQDSFVRVTAMNICLNTLRLATVCDVDEDDPSSPINSPSKSSPDGVLHNSDPLPIRERLAIAQHVCAPSRVEGLVSPIFTKLARLWGQLEETIREADAAKSAAGKSSGTDAPSSGNSNDHASTRRQTKAEKAKEEARKSRLADSVKDTVADIQDEYLLLEDVFKVGLTSLNEQIIEMMFATFVYPLLLQPLLLYTQRFPSDQISSTQVNPFSADSLSSSLCQSGLLGNTGASDVLGEDPLRRRADTKDEDSAAAKTAFLAIAGVFHLVTNRPLLRLLLTALFHPLSPEASGDTMIRARPDVACARHDGGGVYLRLDEPYDVDDSAELIPYGRSTYLFGKLTGRRYSVNTPITMPRNGASSQDASCVFVLSPALAAVLESTDGELSLISRTRPNPYRRAILSCVCGTGAFSGLRAIAAMAVDAAVSRFDSGFVGDMLFGAGLKTFGNDIPMDERRIDTRIVRDRHDRDMGGSGALKSRHTASSTETLARRTGGGQSNYNTEVISALCMSIMSASSHRKGAWCLEFDRFASHALLCAIRENSRALQTTAKLVERRRYHTAMFLSQLPSHIHNASGADGKRLHFDVTGDEEQPLGTIMNRIFYEPQGSKEHVQEALVRLKDDANNSVDDQSYLVSALSQSAFDDLADTLCGAHVKDDAPESDEVKMFRMAAKCAHAYFRLEAFASLLQDLAATNGRAIQNTKQLKGISISRDGDIIGTDECFDRDSRRSVFVPISQGLGTTLIEERENGATGRSDPEQPMPGTVVGLVGKTAFPCVCEVPSTNASFFGDDNSSVVSEGIKWQSLYLVFLGSYMILAEPERGGSGGNGRIVSSCSLARLKVDRDHAIPVQSGSTARRLLLTHDAFESKPPGLFLFENKPSDKTMGPFIGVQSLRSCVDLWFEDETCVERAAKVLDIKIAKAKARRGSRLLERFSAGR